MVSNVTRAAGITVYYRAVESHAHLIYTLVRGRNLKAAILLRVFAESVIHFDSVAFNSKITLLLLVWLYQHNNINGYSRR